MQIDILKEPLANGKEKNGFLLTQKTFEANKQFILAEEKYQQLLSWYPQEKQAILDYASLEYKTLGKYSDAESLLKDYLFNNLTDYDIRLMLGDVYLEWARELDASKYEEARFHYAKLLSQYGGIETLLFRMMRYFIRTDNYDEAMRLYNGFKKNRKTEIEPSVYAELAGFLIDRSELSEVNEILMQARAIKEDIPELHYQLARYFKMVNIQDEEKKALLAAISLFESNEPLSRIRMGMLIDSYNQYGECLYKEAMYILMLKNIFKKQPFHTKKHLLQIN